MSPVPSEHNMSIKTMREHLVAAEKEKEREIPARMERDPKSTLSHVISHTHVSHLRCYA